MWTNTEQQLIEGVLRHGPDILENCQTSDDLSKYFNRLDQEHLHYPRPINQIDINNWHIPNEYLNLDIEEWLVSICPEENYERLVTELRLFHQHNMIPVLKTMKYVVDTLRSNNIVWGVGRGSSVASYVLYKLGVHRINTMFYELDVEEFLR